tara:strand:+ start:24 stop:569 length:546 start_codon:yes stop_codon:yes gene_type:complete
MEEKQLREFIKSQLNDIISEGRKIRQETPNEFWYLDFKKWAYKKRGKIKKELIEIKNTNRPGGSTGQMFQRMESYWIEWANKNNKEATFIDNINTGGKFGRALILMMIDDNLVFKMDGNKMTGIIGESNVNEIKDMPKATKIWDELVETFEDNRNDSIEYLNKDKSYRGIAIQAIFRAMNF